MFITDKLVYVQIQKTGCTHIAKLLDHTVGGKQVGKHNSVNEELMDSSRIIVSSIRNPWEWYLSLWSFGCDGHGKLHNKVTKRVKKKRVKTNVPHSSGRPLLHEVMNNPFGFAQLIYHSMMKRDPRLWKQCYSDSSNPKLFCSWLRMITDPRYRFVIDPGYGRSSVYKLVGIYTYRYLKLCCKNNQILKSGKFYSINDLITFEQDNCYTTKWIRNESLEEDFIDVVNSSGHELNSVDNEYVISCKRTNTSSRPYRSIQYYYDSESADIVREREALLISKFGYSYAAVSDNL